MIRVGLEVGDLRRLEQAWLALPRGLARKHLRASMRRVAAPYAPQFKAVAPKGPTGNLKRSTRVIAYVARDGNAISRAGFSRGKGGKKGGHARWVQVGTRQRVTKAGENRGRMVGSGFASNVMSKASSVGASTLRHELEVALEKATNELPRYLAARKR